MAQAPQYTPTEAQLSAIAARYGLGELRAWRPLAGGVVNPVLLLNDSVVLRINGREPGNPKVAKEAWALAFVAAHPAPEGWRVPTVLAADTSRDILPYDYLLLDFVAGPPAGEQWDAWDEPTRYDVSQQMGLALAHLHSLDLPPGGYGAWDSARGAFGADDDWRVMMRQRNEHLLGQAAALGALTPVDLDAVRGWLERYLDALPARPRRVLAHGDFGLWNVLLDPAPAAGPRIGAILDFEWAQTGPPALDFAPLLFEPTDPIVPAAFIAAYASRQPFDAAVLRETLYYELQYHLDLLGVVHKFWGSNGGEIHHAGIADLLAGRLPCGYAQAGCAWPF